MEKDEYEESSDIAVAIEKKEDVDEPPMVNVILINDDYTPMDFVVDLLVGVFRKNSEEAIEIMLKVHVEGKAIVATYPLDIATLKRNQAMEKAKEAQFPLLVVLEPAAPDYSPRTHRR